MRIPLAVIHLLALGIGLGAIYARARALRRLSLDSLKHALAADTWWLVAAILWIGTGLWRLLAGAEKTTSYYWTNSSFWVKMALLALILVLEIWPVRTFIGWRMAAGRGTLPAVEQLTPQAERLSKISYVQLLLVIGMVVAATLMARGFGAR